LAAAPARGRSTNHVHLASSEGRAEEIARALVAMAPDVEVLLLPGWDCLPFDRASPSRDVMGRRMSVLRRLGERAPGKRVLLVAPEALLQKLPPQDVVAAAGLDLAVGQRLDRDALCSFAMGAGYVLDDRIDEPGEIAVLGEVVDVFPADAAKPVRVVTDEDGCIIEMRTYDPITQRSEGEIEQFRLGAASELVRGHDPGAAQPPPRTPGIEHRLAEAYDTLGSLFERVPKASFSQDDKAPERLAEVAQQIQEAFAAHRDFGLALDDAVPSADLYLRFEEAAAALAAWRPRKLSLHRVGPTPRFASTRNPGRAFCDFVQQQIGERRRVVLTGMAHERRALARALDRGLSLTPVCVEDWAAAMGVAPGAVAGVELDLDAGFADVRAGLVVIAAADVLGGRLAARRTSDATALAAEPDLRIGDVVLHEDHGIGVLRDLETVEIDGVERDTLRLEYHGGASVLVAVEDIGRVWRYGAEESAVTLDRLNGEAWPKRRAEVSRHLDATAGELVELAASRAAATCDPISPPKGAYARFATGFGYPETPDQAAAIDAVLTDLASGRPMDRLICGDVGFGKTEIALRAAAAVALSGRQVAIAAPTTVLAKQHFHTFRRRFASSGVEVAQLSRLVGAAEARDVRAALRTGEVRVVIGTHALASEDIGFADLGLMIVDEEQKFGAGLKARLRNLAEGGHFLSMTATPIPRTLQAAMVGLQDVSVIASPPARRRPVRTFLAPFDPASVRTALLREHRRGGQGFVVAPRIEDLAPLAERLAELVPELSVKTAHGELPAEAVDDVMVGFAEGEGDVLLATNIIESGLDVPRANTIVICRPDRFGLAQLHQLRGRVGRGRAQGVAYLLWDAIEELPDATRARLSTLEAFDRLGSGLAISARDLDLRGGGDLVGEEQAGHMRMIGAGLYHQLLDRAIRVARGETVEAEESAVLRLDAVGALPADYLPDPITRINLYARLARLDSPEEVDDFAEELLDRFGGLPAATETLLAQARLRLLARSAGVREIGVGPRAVALTLRSGSAPGVLQRAQRVSPTARLKADRIIAPRSKTGLANTLFTIERLLTAIAA
jgi:transcription-repair coupling factor (superfamily II helicase)